MKNRKIEGSILGLTFESLPSDIAANIQARLDIEGVYGITFLDWTTLSRIFTL